MNPDYQIILLYNYTHIENPEEYRDQQRALCEKLNLKGRILIAHEGINTTLEGKVEDIDEYLKQFLTDPRFTNTHVKKSVGTGNAFPRLVVKARPEIVSGHLDEHDVNPSEITGKHLSAEELHNWIHSDKEFYIVDMRNDYEQTVGYFEGSIFAPFANFRDLPKILPMLESFREKTLVTVCTGGVRCEKASGFLVKNGFKDVYQLFGGIVTYMEKYPNEDFKGKLYVFDGRVIMGFNVDDPTHEIVGKCELCHKTSEHFVNCKNDECHKHFICCEECLNGEESMYCSNCAKDSDHIK